MILNQSEIADVLRERRLELNLSQAEVATAAGLGSPSTLSNYERGLVPSPPVRRKLARP